MSEYLPEDWIEQVRNASDIVSIIESYVPLKKSGGGFFGVCPFHNEKTASFHVEPERQIYHCFGCGVGGNVISFIMAIERIEFVEAVYRLAERANIPRPKQLGSSKESELKRNERERNYSANREAAYLYYKQLNNDRSGFARSYLQQRGITDEIIKTFGIGFAIDEWTQLKEFLIGKGYNNEELVKFGLLVENNQRTYDRFRNRIIIPIIDERNRVIGFGGRVLDKSLPKYINSSDSLVYQKKNSLFGLNIIKKIRPLKNLIIVEGYMDVVALHQFGFKNVVASLGTALTENQARLIKRYVSEVIIAYDGDQAGKKATLKGLDILSKVGCKVRVMMFPEGLDPDETLRKKGVTYFKKALEEAISLVEFKIACLLDEIDITKPEGKTAFATEAINILMQVENVLERDVYIQKIQKMTGFNKALLYQQIANKEKERDKGKYKNNSNGNIKHAINKAESSVAISNTNTFLLNSAVEKQLISLMAQNKTLAKQAINNLDESDIVSSGYKAIFRAIKEILAEDIEISVPAILGRIRDQEVITLATSTFMQAVYVENTEHYLADCIKDIKTKKIKEKIQRLKQHLGELEKKGLRASTEYKELLSEVSELSRKLYSKN